ncbi:MAG TPA: metallophosphoesterase [Dehalococcoidia bacterium]|nr:metallophosphoesterase [Dehalococcoidia bacterium]
MQADTSTPAPAPSSGGLTLAHSSDLHIGGRSRPGEELASLRAVLEAAAEARAQALILAGDVFDSHRAPAPVVAAAASMLAEAAIDVVILPGNHDPAIPDAVYRRDGMATVPNVHILGVTAGDTVRLPHLDLEVSGAPHTAYADMTPLLTGRVRTLRWHVVVAHGHWVTGPHDAHRGWLIHDDDLDAAGADYIALGHWDVPQPAGRPGARAYYSGSPEVARTVNVVRFSADGVDVRRHPLRLG